MRRHTGGSRWLWPCGWLSILASGLLARTLLPAQYIFGASYDDELMVRMARGFVDGHWSTSWSASGMATLAKPVGFPLFLAGAHFLPWSPLVSIYLVYLLGASLVAWSWHRMAGSPVQATVLLAALVWSPVLFAQPDQRIYRDSCIDAAITLAVGLAFVVAAELTTGSAGGRGVARPARLAGLLVLIGLGVGFAAITKPTWYWAIAAVAAPIAGPVLLRARAARHRLAAIGIVLGVVVVAGTTFGVIDATRLVNRQVYGVALVEDFSSGGLAQAWKAWASVEAGPPVRFEPITRPMRLAVYKVSPEARLIEPYLEAPDDPWKELNCATSPAPCDGSGRYFEWDLRAAAAASGGVGSETQFQAFFDELAGQISTACRDGSLRCSSSPVLATGLPPLDAISLATVAAQTARGVWSMVVPDYVFGTTTVAPTTAALYAEWASVVPDLSGPDAAPDQPAVPGLYSLLRLGEDVFRVANVALLAVSGLALVSLAAGRGRRREPRSRTAPVALVAAGVFLLATLMGMATLAVFDVGQSATYLIPLYWSDFATPAELFVVFAAFAAWPVLRGRRSRAEGRCPRSAGTSSLAAKQEVALAAPSGSVTDR